MTKKLKKGLSCTAIVIIILLISLILMSCMSKRPDNLGLEKGKLSGCPDKPNCVCSFENKNNDQNYIEPLNYTKTAPEVKEKIKEILGGMPRTEIIEEKENYLYAECTSLIFRFTDDLEIYIDEGQKLIHFRSASRVGYSDLGVNRARVKKIKKKLSDF